jgi:hypothetical protein
MSAREYSANNHSIIDGGERCVATIHAITLHSKLPGNTALSAIDDKMRFSKDLQKAVADAVWPQFSDLS